MSSEDPWEVLPLDWSISSKTEAKVQRKWPVFQNRFCFGYNFLTNANFSILLSLLIYTFPILRKDIDINHIQGQNIPGHNGQYGQNGHNGRYGIASYGHKYG